MTCLAMDHLENCLPSRLEPLVLPWPTRENPAGLMQFHEVSHWQKFHRDLDLDVRVPAVVRLKYARAQKLYLLGLAKCQCKQFSFRAHTLLLLIYRRRDGYPPRGGIQGVFKLTGWG